MARHRPLSDARVPCRSDIRQQIEVFIALIFPPSPAPSCFSDLDELDSLDPLDHRIAKRILRSESQGSAIDSLDVAGRSFELRAGTGQRSPHRGSQHVPTGLTFW